MSARQEVTAEQLIADAKAILEHDRDNPLRLSPLPITEGACAWLNTGLLPSSISGREEEEIVRAIVTQALAAMMLDGYSVVKAGPRVASCAECGFIGSEAQVADGKCPRSCGTPLRWHPGSAS